MDRRESLKSLLVGSVAGGLVLNGCAPAEQPPQETDSAAQSTGYGRTPEEKERDEKLRSQQYFNHEELTTLAVLCDIILPAEADFGSATDAGVPEFIEFMAKDMPNHQLPLRGGIMWLNNQTNERFNLDFSKCSDDQQLAVIDEIAYPGKTPEHLKHGEKFFSLMRNLTLTGYYTSEIGIKDLGYVGNQPNVWDGIPQEVLDEHNLSYDPEWIARCVDQEKRNDIAEWDEEGNLLT
ncbi:MAG: hypothetical protein DHS20C17_18190 [Cyclobacteriaceae bacterium]|nr:MAG: hypothetical protein DHS20C17_18190 [Cyclobacteriaceae bacterium]